MKITSRLLAAFVFVCSITQMSATPLLFVNYNAPQTTYAQGRAGALGLTYDTVAGFTSVSDLAGKSVVIMPGFTTYSYLLNDATILRDFVQAGGYLWINVAGAGCATDFGPGGVDFLQYTCGGAYNQSEIIVNPAHPYLQGSFDARAKPLSAADFMNWNVTDLGHLAGLPANATNVMHNAQGATLAEYSYGQGWVVLSTMTYGWGDAGAKGAPMDNMLLYAASQIRGSAPSLPPPSGTETPEPANMLLTASGMLFGLTWLGRRRC